MKERREIVFHIPCKKSVLQAKKGGFRIMSKSGKTKKAGRIGKIIVAIFLVLVVVVNVLLVIFEGHVNLYLGRGELITSKAEGTEEWDSEYYKVDYDTSEEMTAASEALVAEIASEGFVLLKNNGTLPLASGGAVTLMGRGSADSIYGGAGSGSVDTTTAIDLYTSMKNAGFTINDTVYNELVAYASFTMVEGMFGMSKEYDNPKANIVMDSPETSSYYIGEMPVDQYSDDAIASFATYNDAAIITISRGGGEGGDLARDMDGWDENYEEGQHELELNYDEKQQIALAEENFENVIILINSSNIMELGVLEEDPNVDAILWIGSPGQTGFEAVGQIISGEVNPSGHTVDIYPADFTQDPTFNNFGYYQYSNISEDNAIGNAYFVQYEEGIYVGYRYYETAAVENFINYDEAVVYPFGFGLSYTTFEWAIADHNFGNVNGDITVDVTVTNTGDVAGKDVVELYYSAPYTTGGIEKAEVVLGAFEKTSLLQPGESETLTLTFAVEDMASYDYKNAEAYVLEKGDYDIRVQTDSHTVVDSLTYTVNNTIVYDEEGRASDVTIATNQFDDVSSLFVDTATEGYALNMSRADFAGTFPTAPTEADYVANDEIIAGFQAYVAADHEDADAVMPTTGASNGLSLIDLRGLPYNSEAYELLLDQLTVEEIVAVVMDGAYNTGEMPSVNKPATVEIDGPAGLSAFMGSQSGTAFTSEVVIASTYNKELAYKMGAMVGNEALSQNVSGWYAPAMNIHRSPFAGRNFEYYSEDPLLSGTMGEYVVEGAMSKGLTTFIKHFALNDQETNRVNNGVSSWANEQAIREIYLKPFEITVKKAETTITYIADAEGTVVTENMKATTALMSSFNRIGATWAGGNIALMQNVLRDEWGFEGVAITDFNLYDYMYANQGIHAGTDYNLTFISMKTIEDTTSATAVSDLRRSAHRMFYSIANSNAMNGIVPGTTITYTMAIWRKVQIAADVVIAILVVVGVVVVQVKKKKKSTEETEEAVEEATAE